MSRRAQWEYLCALYARDRRASRAEPSRILDECCRICGYHRKSAIRLLNGPRPEVRLGPRRARGPTY